ncbi:unnamed protein product [Musa acuminata subsp. malaccensis]|uniref:(wild Malaysian banana) hypothetical protein n=1 Tax=Musa acuminata subsp. malaccensis TaxID=214687 RepID=A0A804JQY1_MUSAM|nr:unnamed protein product [Musa acuminata subsp. malaccensis]
MMTTVTLTSRDASTPPSLLTIIMLTHSPLSKVRCSIHST